MAREYITGDSVRTRMNVTQGDNTVPKGQRGVVQVNGSVVVFKFTVEGREISVPRCDDNPEIYRQFEKL